MKPRLLDLFSGAGGASYGYALAGFDLTGVDIVAQPRYPFPSFIQTDALQYLSDLIDAHYSGRSPFPFEAVHASPPCQRHSTMSNCRPGLAGTYPDLIAATRALLKELPLGIPWVIENVPGAPLRADLTLCGCMFDLPLYRPRLFEFSPAIAEIPYLQPAHPEHTVLGSAAGHWKPGTIISVSGHCAPIEEAKRAMQIDWMRREELAEAIPPAFTRYTGRRLLRASAFAA